MKKIMIGFLTLAELGFLGAQIPGTQTIQTQTITVTPGASPQTGTGAPENPLNQASATAAKTPAGPQEVRIKDIARIEGLRTNQLTGIGLVTGLSGQGDSSSSPLTQYALSSLVNQLGITVSPDMFKSKNAAVVSLSVILPPFARVGDLVDVQVASLGDAKSLEGGQLIQAPLLGANGKTYAVASGRIQLPLGKNPQKTAGTIPLGGILETGLNPAGIQSSGVTFLLNNPDFTTASQVGAALTKAFPDAQVKVLDAGRISVGLPASQSGNPVDFVSKAEVLKVVPDMSARVVVNKASGVVVAGRYVQIAPCAVSVKGAKVSIGKKDASLSSSSSKGNEQFLMSQTGTVEDLVTLMQQLGLDTDTVIEVLRAIDQAGALYGTLEIK